MIEAAGTSEKPVHGATTHKTSHIQISVISYLYIINNEGSKHRHLKLFQKGKN
jgi:hypothetical protein